MLGNFSYFLSSADFFFKLIFLKNSFRNAVRMSNNLDPDQARQFGSKLFAKVISNIVSAPKIKATKIVYLSM